jgi:polysaccharide pyruvyl transferase CsaB
MKKILLATMSLGIGGAETHIVELSEKLTESGYRVYIISNGGVYEETIKNSGIIHIKSPLHTKNPFSLIKSYFKIRKAIILNGIDIVHAHARIPAFICNIICKKLNIPFVTTVHYEFRTSFLFKKFTRWGSHTLSVSRDVQDYLIQNYHYNKNRAGITVNGINTKTFHPMVKDSDILNEFSIKSDDFIIGTVCRIDRGSSKTAFMLAEIANQLDEEIKNLKILIVGGGNQFDRLSEKVKAVNKKAGRKIIHLTGPRSDINRLLSVMDIFAGISRAALESMAMAKPVVLCGDMGYLGIMDEESRAMAMDTNMTCRGMASPSNIKLKTDLVLLYENNEIRKSNSKLNLETVSENYTVDRMSRDAIEMYNKAVSEMNGVPKTYHAVLSGYYGFENSGDEAMLSSIIDELRSEKNDIRLLVLTKKPDETKQKYNVDAIGRSNPISLIKAFKHAGTLISGGGNLIQDLTSFQSMLYYTGLMKYAIIRGMKVMLYANGIGPLQRKVSIKIASKILDKTDVITVREPNSYEMLNDIGVHSPYISITADPVMGLELPVENNKSEILSGYKIPIEGKKAVFSARPWKGMESKFEPIFAEIADYLYEKHKLIPIFVPLHSKKDTRVCQEIIGMMKNKAYLVENENSAMDLITIAGEAELVIGMRLHSLIYASVARIPVIGIVYDPKVRYFIELMDQEDGGLVENISFDDIRTQAEVILSNRDKYIERISSKMDRLKKQCKRNAEIAIRLIEGESLDE